MEINLHDISGTKKIKESIEKNINCLKFKCFFKNQGNQGLTGVYEIEDINDCCVFKIPTLGNYTISHESIVLESLYSLTSYCINFPIYINSYEQELDNDYYNKRNPFARSKKKGRNIQILLAEYIKSVKLRRFISDPRVSNNMIFSAINQVMYALMISQYKKKLTHYDLHSSNVMIKNCDKNIVFVYIFKDSSGAERWECIPSDGVCAVIIDFGYSYVQDNDSKPLYASMEYLDLGYTSNYFDEYIDMQKFLISISMDFKNTNGRRCVGNLRKKIKKIFHTADHTTGWESHGECRQKMHKILSSPLEKKTILEKNKDLFIENIQTLIDLPLCCTDKKENIIKDTRMAFEIFINEWIKIENEIRYDIDCLSILEGIIKSVRQLKLMYESKGGDRKKAIRSFRAAVYTEIEKVAELCSPKNIEFELLFCSILFMSRGLLYVLHKKYLKIKKTRAAERNNISAYQIHSLIKENIPIEYTYTTSTNFLIMDSIQEKCFNYTFENHTDIVSMNETSKYEKGLLFKQIFNRTHS